jgi:hypothetical protein
LTGRFQFKIYDDAQSVSSRRPIGTEKPLSSSIYASPKSPGSPYSSNGESRGIGEINVHEINRCLSRMDVDEVRKRRIEYNLYFKVGLSL